MDIWAHGFHVAVVDVLSVQCASGPAISSCSFRQFGGTADKLEQHINIDVLSS